MIQQWFLYNHDIRQNHVCVKWTEKRCKVKISVMKFEEAKMTDNLMWQIRIMTKCKIFKKI